MNKSANIDPAKLVECKCFKIFKPFLLFGSWNGAKQRNLQYTTMHTWFSITSMA